MTSTTEPTSTITLTPTAEANLGEGVMGYWSFDAINGTSLPDDSGREHTGTLNGATPYWNGWMARAVSFDGVNDNISIPYSTDFAPGGSFAITAWVYPQEIATGRNTRIIDRSGVFALRFDTNGYLQFRVEGLTPAYVTGPKLPVNVWSAITAVYDDEYDRLKLSVNGDLVASVAVTGTKAANTNVLYFGSSTANEYFKGILDEVRFYNRTLTPDEITDIQLTPTATNNPAQSTFTATFTPTATLSSTPSSVYLTITPTAVAGGGTVSVSWAGRTYPTTTDWIGLYVPGAGDTSYYYWFYTSSCTTTAGSPAKSSGSCSATMPVTEGTYEFRMFAQNGYTKLATSSPVIVAAATSTPTVTLTATSTQTPTLTLTPMLPGNSPWGNGSDGSLSVATGTTYNMSTQNHSGRTCADGGDAAAYNVTTLTAGYTTLASTPSSGCLNVNDEVLLINLQGSSASTLNVGRYEFLRVASITANTVYFSSAKIQYYGESQETDDNIGTGTGQQRVMLQRVPNYTNVTVNGTLTAAAWDGLKGGVLALRASGTLSGSYYIAMNSNGYRGGAGVRAYYQGGYQGEGLAGVGVVSTAANSGGGGGGPVAGGGGGGGHGTSGQTSPNDGSPGGTLYGNAELDRIYLGSGGGGGGSYLSTQGGNGGNGGGIIFVAADTIDMTGQFYTAGNNGGAGSTSGGGGGGGGGGAGGSLRIEADEILALDGINGAAGAGGNYIQGGQSGGNGGVGRLAVYYQTSSASFSSSLWLMGTVLSWSPCMMRNGGSSFVT